MSASWDPVETMPTDALRELQEQRLRALVDRLLAADGWAGRRLRSCGVADGRDISLAELSRLPATDKSDLWENYPFGMLEVPLDRVVTVHGSSGTGGRPTLVAYTQDDLNVWASVCARALAGAGAGPGSIVHNAYGYGLFTGGLGIHQGAVALGAMVVPMSGGMTSRQLRMISDLRPQVLTCTPSYAVHLGEAARSAGVDLSSLQVGIFGAEPWTQSMREGIESLLGLMALDIYGLSEVIGPGVACECLQRDGLHVAEDHFIVEAIDPASGETVADGTVGELVFTTVTKQALPLLRYRTGDLASLDRRPCPCGRTLVRMSKVVGRRDDMLVIRGVNVYPSEVEAVLLAEPSVAPHYLLVVDRRRPAAELVVACEWLPGASGSGELVSQALRERLGLRAQVVALAAGSLPRPETGKVVRVVHWESGPAPLPGLDGG
ncbi:MAG: phenylacetate--CoA ligase family protein [Mycobacteriales bacterium]